MKNCMKILSGSLAGVLILGAWTGCVGYKLGSTLPPDIQTVYVPTFINETDEPLLEVDVTRATIQEVQREGSLRLAAEDVADTILEVRILTMTLDPLAFDRSRRAAAEEYRLTITASLLLTRRTSGEVVAEHPGVYGNATFILSGDMTSAKQSAIPRAARDLAHQIVTQMVEVW